MVKKIFLVQKYLIIFEKIVYKKFDIEKFFSQL